ncbi:MAG: YjjG family noncanonical pyrimidine nucleotidase [Verrucomicrobia bacterium]|nr:YjjG family noncanonical pyrimidine nucleotidase [Verrucomicrobiota bacterium]
MYTTVLFDIDDTLLDFKRSEEIGLKSCWSRFFPDLEQETFVREYCRINRALWKQVEQGSVSPTFLKQARFSQVAAHFGIPFDPAVSHHFEELLIEQTRFLEGAEELLHHLKERHVKIGFVTNGFAHIQHSKYKLLKLSRFTDVLVISEEEGISKPHPKIFKKALDLMGAKASDTLMVGDSLESDGQGARNLNMKFCWYNPFRMAGHWEPDYTIAHLDEIGKIF